MQRLPMIVYQHGADVDHLYRWQLAEAEIQELCHKAERRDSDRVADPFASISIGGVIQQLVNPRRWRQRVLKGVERDDEVPDVTRQKRDDFAVAMCGALKIVLGPWFRGDADLNYEAFHRLSPFFDQLRPSWDLVLRNAAARSAQKDQDLPETQ